MYAYWYEDGKVMAYEGSKADFKLFTDMHSYYIYGEFNSMPNDWFKTEMINGINGLFNIFAEDVPSDIRAMHLLLVKE